MEDQTRRKKHPILMAGRWGVLQDGPSSRLPEEEKENEDKINFYQY